MLPPAPVGQDRQLLFLLTPELNMTMMIVSMDEKALWWTNEGFTAALLHFLAATVIQLLLCVAICFQIVSDFCCSR